MQMVQIICKYLYYMCRHTHTHANTSHVSEVSQGLLGEYVLSSALSRHNKNLKRWTSSQMDRCYSSVLQLSFIQKIKENTSLRREGMPTQKTQREEGRCLCPLAPLFMWIFSLPSGLALCILGQPGVLFVLPEVLTVVLRTSFVLFSQTFPFLGFQPLPFWTPFSILTSHNYGQGYRIGMNY